MTTTNRPVVLTRLPNGTYQTKNGRYTISPVTMGDSPRNKGHREWKIVDNANHAARRKFARTLADARDYLATR